MGCEVWQKMKLGRESEFGMGNCEQSDPLVCSMTLIFATVDVKKLLQNQS